MNTILKGNTSNLIQCGRQCRCFKKIISVAMKIPANQKEKSENIRELLYEQRSQKFCPNFRRIQKSLPSK